MRSILTSILLLTCSPALSEPTPPNLASPVTGSAPGSRILKHFDFDERKLGNYESMPRFWRPIQGPGYPRFLEPAFDFEIGHDAAPSFRLPVDSGDVGAELLAKEIEAHPGADYRVTAWVLPSRLTHARAHLAAFYLDSALRKIAASERRSDAINGAGVNEPWSQVSIVLPGSFPEARWIGLSCRVEQSRVRSDGIASARPIRRLDAKATAWFDDITIVRLPALSLEMGSPGNVFGDDGPVTCTARVADLAGGDLRAKLELIDARGRLIEELPVPVVAPDDSGLALSLGNPRPGWYSARLSAATSGAELLAVEQAFVRLNPDLPMASRVERGFGVITDAGADLDPRITVHLIEALGVGAVKLPLWREDLSEAAVVRGDKYLDQLIRPLRQRGVSVVAMLEAPPEVLVRRLGQEEPSLVQVFSAPAERWRPYLTLPLTRYGAMILACQIGPDSPPARPEDQRLVAATGSVRSEITPLLGPAQVAAACSADERAENAAPPADVAVVTVPPHIPSDRLADYLGSVASAGGGRVWATIQPPEAGRYQRQARLAELARRLVVARAGGAETVFLKQPWLVTANYGATTVTPTEDFVIYSTLARTLDDLRPVGPVDISPGVAAWLFSDSADRAGALVAWTQADGDRASTAVADFGPDARRIDLWGNVTELDAAEDGRGVSLDAAPCVITPVSPLRVRALADFKLVGPALQASVQPQQRNLAFTNPRPVALHGRLSLQAPDGWRVEPQEIPLDVAAGRSTTIPVTLYVPGNQSVGSFTLLGRLDAEGDALDGLILRATAAVDSPGLDVNVLARREGDTLIIHHRLTNRTEKRLDLRTKLFAPEVPRHTQTISNLAPGQTVIREFQIEEAMRLAGRSVRFSIEQINGPLHRNDLISLPP